MEEEQKLDSLEMIKELQQEHQANNENPEIEEMQKKLKISRKKQENAKYKSALSQELMQELRQKFQNSLNKLNSIDTRDVATKEVRLLIERNNSMEALRIYIGCLGEHRKAKSPLAREQEVLLIGYISQIYEEKLIEDKNSPLRLLVRLAEIVQMYFKDLNRKVHEAAADSMCMIYKYSLPKNSQQVVFTFMFEPLNSILSSGIDVQAQQAAALTIFKWSELLTQEKDKETLNVLLQRVMTLFLKLRADFADLVSAIGLMVETVGFQVISESIIPLLTKLIQYLKCTNNYAHLLKIEACRLLSFFAAYFRENGGFEAGQIVYEIINALKEVRTDKLPLVQSAAREALKGWEMLSSSPISIEDPKISRELKKSDIKESKDSIELPQIKSTSQPPVKSIFPNHFKAIRDLVKIQKEKSQKSNLPQVEKSVQRWGISKPGYLKRGSGQYSYAEHEGAVNINRALDKRTSVKEYLQQKRLNSAPPRETVEILYKKDSQLNVYKRQEENKEKNSFIEEKVSGNEQISAASWQKEEENKFMGFEVADTEKPTESGNLGIYPKDQLKDGDFIVRKKVPPKVTTTAAPEEVNEAPKEEQEVFFLHERQESQFLNPSDYPKLKALREGGYKPTPSSLVSDSVELKGENKPKNPPEISSQNQIEQLQEFELISAIRNNPALKEEFYQKALSIKADGHLNNLFKIPEESLKDSEKAQENLKDILAKVPNAVQIANPIEKIDEKIGSPRHVESAIAKKSRSIEDPRKQFEKEEHHYGHEGFPPASIENPNEIAAIKAANIKIKEIGSPKANIAGRQEFYHDDELVPNIPKNKPDMPENEDEFANKAISQKKSAENIGNPDISIKKMPKKALDIQIQSHSFNFIPPKKDSKIQEFKQNELNSKLKEEIGQSLTEFKAQIIEEVIQQKPKIEDQIEFIEEEPELRKSYIHPPIKAQKNSSMKQFNEAFKESVYELQDQMEQAFDLMAGQLNSIEERIFSAQETLYLLTAYNELSLKDTEKSSLKSPMWTQTLVSTEIQTSFVKPDLEEPEKPKLSHKASLTSNNPDIDKSIQVSPAELGHKPPSPKSAENPNPQPDPTDLLTLTWSSTIKKLDPSNLDSAYKSILETGDDIYLLRLMHKTGPCFHHFSPATSSAVLSRLSLILNSNFIESLSLTWLLESIQLGCITVISSDEKTQVIDALERISYSNDEEGQLASELSSYIQRHI
ncbi:unnamed protein product [Blepharisma stoltei]|uniref:Uncharacterized protein n=1 Tax=Blepharisma stoltei TaxID=1481888 RepID=A0AAU9K926_9CILI|nr:unnamed protein product [Blepharisma stoltei]